jgi:5-methylcytosine-specific restriction enzyme A
MPTAPMRPCTYPGCPSLTDSGRCETHKRQQRKAIDARRGTAAQRGYDSNWKAARDWYLRNHPLCVICQANGIITAAQVVDHIKPHKGDHKLFWDRDNWQALCESCHNSKTAREDGRWG